MATSLRFLTLFGVVQVHALAFPGPRPTDPVALPGEFFNWAPMPTPAPNVGILRRQADLPDTYLLAPDNTCGFISASSKSPYACDNEAAKCAFFPASGRNPGVAACCRGSSCSFRTSCVVKDDCDKECQADAGILKCSDDFCATISFPGGVMDYFCTTKRVAGVVRAHTTHAGDRDREMSTITPTPTTSSRRTSTSKSSSTSSSSKSSSTQSSSTESSSTESTESSATESSTSSETTETTSATTTPDGERGDSTTPTSSNTAAASATETNDAEAAPASSPTGAIVGGVIGGLALIAMVGFGALFLRRRSKNDDSDYPPAPPFITQQPIAPMSQPPAPSYPQNTTSNMSGYPVSNDMSGYAASNGMSGYPAANDMYAVPAAAGVGGAAAAAATRPYHNQQHYPHHQPTNSYSTGHTHGYSMSHSHNPYPDPSPMSTPGASPHMQHYQHQTHAPPPLPQPSYYQAHDAWSGPADVPDRRDNSTPVSTYNGTTPVQPASALGPMPGEPQAPQGNSNGVPLILQPGMGYRPYRPAGAPSTAPTVSSMSAESPIGDARGDQALNAAQPGAAAAAAGNQQQQQQQQPQAQPQQQPQQQQQQQQSGASNSEAVELP
ncbi:hypothetical protein VTJ49DRAFT_605 [Mycothermus thermophilus]|uniref:Uncharacterized protein n=1 Tax=Humicola insolens TaxID=85995 RepID=A0ABR3VNY7_HUMIN